MSATDRKKKLLLVSGVLLVTALLSGSIFGVLYFRDRGTTANVPPQQIDIGNPVKSSGSGAASKRARVLIDSEGVFHVRPGMSIQDALDAAASQPNHKAVLVHEGTYRPTRHGQAMIWLNSKHEGITLEAKGEVILTAENPDVADPSVASYPAVVNHVVYFGDGISRATTIRGFKITGANHFVTRSEDPAIQPPVNLPGLEKKRHIYYADGGGIKTWGRCYPVIDRCEIYGNFVSPCAGAISIENCGYTDGAVLITNCILRNNKSQITGSAIDLYGAGNRAEIRNCLFVGNVANRGLNFFAFPKPGFNEAHGSGALTVFSGSHILVDRCTFTGNYNGVDDAGIGNTYTNCLFWNNNASGGIAPKGRYEMDVLDSSKVTNCYIGGNTIHDLRGTIGETQNSLDTPDPKFDSQYRPTNPYYDKVGFRPVGEKK